MVMVILGEGIQPGDEFVLFLIASISLAFARHRRRQKMVDAFNVEKLPQATIYKCQVFQQTSVTINFGSPDTSQEVGQVYGLDPQLVSIGRR